MRKQRKYLGGDGAEVLGPDGPRRARPVAAAVPPERRPRGGHRGVDVLRRARRDLADLGLGGRVDDGEPPALRGRAPLPVDEELPQRDRRRRGHR